MTDEAIEDFDWGLAREKFRTKHKPGKKPRRQREKAGEDAVDGRSLKATGRTQHCNLRCTREVKAAFHKAAGQGAGVGNPAADSTGNVALGIRGIRLIDFIPLAASIRSFFFLCHLCLVTLCAFVSARRVTT